MKHIVLYILFFTTFVSCGNVQKAKQVIREADSMRIQGCLYQDSIAYYYAVNSMAFELAELGKKMNVHSYYQL